MKKAPFNPEVLNHEERQTIKMFVNLINRYPYLKTTRGRRPPQNKEDLNEREVLNHYLRLNNEIEQIGEKHGMEIPSPIESKLVEIVNNNTKLFGR